MNSRKLKARKNRFVCPICHLELHMHDVDENGLVVCPVCGAVLEVTETNGHKIPIVHNVEIKRPQPMFRLHTIATHFSIGLLPLALLSNLIAFVFYLYNANSWTLKAAEFEWIGYWLLLISFVGGLATFLTGLVDWKRKYRGRTYTIITKKIRLSFVLFIVLTAAVGLRVVAEPGLSLTYSLYVVLQIASLGIISTIGHYGGFLVHGK